MRVGVSCSTGLQVCSQTVPKAIQAASARNEPQTQQLMTLSNFTRDEPCVSWRQIGFRLPNFCSEPAIFFKDCSRGSFSTNRPRCDLSGRANCDERRQSGNNSDNHQCARFHRACGISSLPMKRYANQLSANVKERQPVVQSYFVR